MLCTLFQQFHGHFHGHALVAGGAGVQVVAGVVCGQEVVGIIGIPEGPVKVDAAVDEIGGADKVIVGVAHLLSEGRVGAPAAHGEQGANVDLIAVAAGLGDIAL